MAILLFTSGTTSKSKAVMLSQRNIASNIYAIQSVEDIKNTDTNIAFLPYHHIKEELPSNVKCIIDDCGYTSVRRWNK